MFIGALIKYFLLGSLVAAADQGLSKRIRSGKRLKKQAEFAKALRYLLEHYEPTSFEQDAQKPEFREALTVGQDYFRQDAIERQQERLERIVPESEPPPGASLGTRLRRWLAQEKISPLSVREKAILSGVIVLALDVWTLFSGGFGAFFWALLASLIEAPALFAGLHAAPGVSWLLSTTSRLMGNPGPPEQEAAALAEKIQTQKRSLHLRLTSALPFKKDI